MVGCLLVWWLVWIEFGSVQIVVLSISTWIWVEVEVLGIWELLIWF